MIINSKKTRDKFSKLELDVFTGLVERIEKFGIMSKHGKFLSLKVNVFDYVEIAYINEKLVFFDEKGLIYSVYADCSLDDLIDILEQYDYIKI